MTQYSSCKLVQVGVYFHLYFFYNQFKTKPN
nr:MAG TPA: hypothetical protein [Caudoviricetes sp.]DAL79720.1 MAG TPA: hypothetical protein [Caudoviricetes sp.]DAL91579.1 MAG TPA: hypothetical protein [Caudoviricetes sp.]DAY88591.1 MAG TPA: hypothetical protein [Caudoviricetes sp.]